MSTIEERLVEANRVAMRGPKAHKDKHHAEINRLLDEWEMVRSGAFRDETSVSPVLPIFTHA